MKILLVRLRLIGDVVFTTPLVNALRWKYPDADLTYVVEPMAAPVVRGNPHLDAVIIVPKRSSLARWRVARVLRDAGVGPLDPLIVMHVSAGNPFRRWPPEAFAAVAVELMRRDPARRVMVLFGPCDEGAARAIVDQARARLGTAAAAVSHGRFDIGELHVLAARAAVYIGGDSGPLHIAATTQTPIAALLGQTLAERSMPWRDPRWFAEAIDAGPLPCRPCHQRRCEPGDFRCLTGIAPDRVVAAAERALATQTRRQSTDVGADLSASAEGSGETSPKRDKRAGGQVDRPGARYA